MALNEPECEPSPSAKSTPIAGASSPNTGQMSLFITTLQNSKAQTLDPSTSSQAGSRAKISAPQARARALPASAVDYGKSTPELLAKYDPDTSSWRTSQHCFLEGLETFSETFPRSGMTRSGTAYLLPPLVRLTDGTASGLWQTPVSDDAVDRTVGKFNSRGEPKLSAEVKMWPTPGAADNRDRGNMSMPSIQRRASLGKQLNLGMVVDPTSGSLNPTWVEWLMGFPLGWTVCDPLATPSSRKSRN